MNSSTARLRYSSCLSWGMWWWLPPFTLAACLLGLLTLDDFSEVSAREWMSHYGVPMQSPLFSDLQLVALWNDRAASGISPYFDPLFNEQGQRLRMNYPPVFLGLSWFGLTAESFNWWGVGMGLLFVAAFTVLARGGTLGSMIVWALLLVSPASLFLMERGNPDILVFSLLVMAIEGARRLPLLIGCVGLASVLKLFPVAGILVFLTKGKIGFWSLLGFAAVFVGYLIFLRPYAEFIFGSLDNNFSCAFGTATVPNYFGREDLAGNFVLAALFLGFLGALMGGIIYWREESAVPADLSLRAVAAGWVSLPVFGLLFLSGVQYDYKVVFVFPAVVTALALWQTECRPWRRSLALAWLVVLIIQVYWMLISGEGFMRSFLLKQAVSWLLFVLSAALGGWLTAALFSSLWGKARYHPVKA